MPFQGHVSGGKGRGLILAYHATHTVPISLAHLSLWGSHGCPNVAPGVWLTCVLVYTPFKGWSPLPRLISFTHSPAPPLLFPPPPSSEDVQDLELKVDVASLERLLDFLARSFMGGTDVDKPLGLALDRLKQQEWAQV